MGCHTSTRFYSVPQRGRLTLYALSTRNTTLAIGTEKSKDYQLSVGTNQLGELLQILRES